MTNSLMKIFPAKLRAKWGDDGSVTIPVVKLQGAIMSGGSPLRPALNLAACASKLNRAFTTKKAPAVAIVINSPGGSPVQSRLIYRRIRDLAEEHDKKVHVFVEDAAASGGYLIACAGDDITADPSSIVGSIGVISASFGFVETIDKLGVERRVHTAGQNKSVMDPFLPEKKSDIDKLKKLQLEIHDVFIGIVKESRGDRLSDDKDMFTGMFWTGQPALERGLIDGLGDVRSSLKQRYGKKTKLKLLETKKGLFGRAQMAGISAATVSPELLSGIAAQAADGMLTGLEERALWNRLGL